MIVFFYDNQVLNLFWCQFVPQRKRLNVSTVATELAIGFLKELHMWKTLFNSFNLPCGWHLWYFLLWSYDITKKKWQGKLRYQNIRIFEYSVKKLQNIRIFVRACFSVSNIFEYSFGPLFQYSLIPDGNLETTHKTKPNPKYY